MIHSNNQCQYGEGKNVIIEGGGKGKQIVLPMMFYYVTFEELL